MSGLPGENLKKYGKCSKNTNTKKYIFFSLFVILEITVVKMLVFKILECGLYHEKNKIYMHVKMW